LPAEVDRLIVRSCHDPLRPWWPLSTKTAMTTMTAISTMSALGWFLALTTPLGCSGGDVAGSPELAVRQLIASARAGDRAAVYQRLGPRTRGRIDEILASARKSGGARLLGPEDLVTVGWVPPAWEASSVHEQSRDGVEANVDVMSAAGDRQTVRVVKEGKQWKVELPLR
jgi:hypothetical protein